MLENSSRMLTLLSLLQTQKCWPGAVLAERLETTSRTIRRDIDKLRALGYQIEAIKGPYGGYSLAAGKAIPPLLFDAEQAIAIGVALQSAPSLGVALEEPATRALTTLQQVMPAHLHYRMKSIEFAPTESDDQADPMVLEVVSTAIKKHKVLRFTYSDKQQSFRRTQPHAIVARRSYWYLIAWDMDKEDWRIYRLDRITPHASIGPSFKPRELPSPDARTFLEARLKGSHAENQWPCTGTFTVELPIKEILPWLNDGELHELSDHSCQVTLGSWSWAGLISLIIRFDAPFTIISPEPLIHTAAKLATRLTNS